METVQFIGEVALMTCANCKTEASYEYQLTHAASIFYCGKHLPKFLEARKKAYLIKVTEKLIEENQTAVNALSPIIEPVVEEKPAPKKKATKKSAK